jgi:hypothetical protein
MLRDPVEPGWPHELVTEVAAAPNRSVAAGLIELSRSAVDGLPHHERETLLSVLQDAIQQLPEERSDED